MNAFTQRRSTPSLRTESALFSLSCLLPIPLPLHVPIVFIMDEYFPDEDDNAANADAPPQVDASGAFAFKSDLAAPQGGFSFGGNNDAMNQ